MCKECELIVKNDSDKFGLFDNRNGSIGMSVAKFAEMDTDCFAARKFEDISVSPV